jgi:hypothetical protein
MLGKIFQPLRAQESTLDGNHAHRAQSKDCQSDRRKQRTQVIRQAGWTTAGAGSRDQVTLVGTRSMHGLHARYCQSSQQGCDHRELEA